MFLSSQGSGLLVRMPREDPKDETYPIYNAPTKTCCCVVLGSMEISGDPIEAALEDHVSRSNSRHLI